MLYNALMATLNPGIEVIIPAPYWVSYPEMVALAGGTPVSIVCSAEQGFKLQPAIWRRRLPEDKVDHSMFAVEPDGRGLYARGVEEITDVLVKHPHVWVMTDGMYEHLVYDDFEFTTPAQVEPKLFDRTLTGEDGVSEACA